MADNEITNIVDIAAVVGACRETFRTTIWWRGHSRASWRLRPTVFRNRDGGVGYERNVAARFRQKAATRHPNCPPIDRDSEWLHLMQHYGVPTRLLDWSESVLVAAFFAVRDTTFDNEDGAIWGLAPALLNQEQMGKQVFVTPDQPPARQVFADVYREGDEEPEGPTLALHSQEIDLRMMAQHSTFTIHGSVTDMVELPDSEKFLVRFAVPAAAKSEFRTILKAFGFSNMKLFPDLEHLAEDIRSLKFQ